MKARATQDTHHTTGTLLAPYEFRLVSFDESGKPRPLPPGLGNLPLFLDDDGFHSVNGPLNLTVLFPSVAIAPVNRGNSTAIHHPITSAISSGQPTHTEKGGHFCNETGCAWKSPFPTKQGLHRHREVKHLNKRVDCPIPGCEKVGDKGIRRKDNLPAHVLKKHGIKLPRQSHG
ncbi:hypothetical protein HOY80DRAFT_970795, partial [Tuber brumale]